MSGSSRMLFALSTLEGSDARRLYDGLNLWGKRDGIDPLWLGGGVLVTGAAQLGIYSVNG